MCPRPWRSQDATRFHIHIHIIRIGNADFAGLRMKKEIAVVDIAITHPQRMQLHKAVRHFIAERHERAKGGVDPAARNFDNADELRRTDGHQVAAVLMVMGQRNQIEGPEKTVRRRTGVDGGLEPLP